MVNCVIVAQITDMHVKPRRHVLHHMPHVIGPLRRSLAAMAALAEPPAFIIATGDLTEGGHLHEYRRLREIVDEIDIPVFLLPGNHDRRETLRAAFPDCEYLHRFTPAVQYVVETPF